MRCIILEMLCGPVLYRESSFSLFYIFFRFLFLCGIVFMHFSLKEITIKITIKAYSMLSILGRNFKERDVESFISLYKVFTLSI